MGNLRKQESKRDGWLKHPLLLLCAICLFSFKAEAVEIDLSRIRQIESSNNPQAVSSKGCIGLYQISKSVLTEYNRFNKTTYTPSHLYLPKVNETIAKWYLTFRIPQMLRYYKKAVTITNILRAYNSGIGTLLKGRYPEETKNYVKMYNHMGGGSGS